MEKKLTVKDLSVSFKTSGGRLQAVRGIDLELGSGETLAIVGESGSGKSVTSKAILGILAGNAIVESGEIIYGGRDLLKLREEDFHSIRGDKIAMVFQDPMSSLNPIVRVGKQLTEAMILKGRSRQRECRRDFNGYLRRLRDEMARSTDRDNPRAVARESCRDFDKFERRHLELESSYNAARENLEEALWELDELILEVSKNAARDLTYRVNQIAGKSRGAVHKYVVSENTDRVYELSKAVRDMARSVKKGADGGALAEALSELRDILKRAKDAPAPNFFALGYYFTFAKEELPELSVDELNRFLRRYLDENFMLEFIEDTRAALERSAAGADKNREAAVSVLSRERELFEREEINKKEAYAAYTRMAVAVRDAIDPLEIKADSLAYSFSGGIKNSLGSYFRGNKEKARNNILMQIDRLTSHYGELSEKRKRRDFATEAVAVIDYLKMKASGVVNRVTRSAARRRALRLMSEVGISDARIRYRQYPFEFSGGMRQRIVIAIALAADPDILICDEPTTALDVTIQSQILELIARLKEERKLSVIFITHDLGVVANMADRIAVMYAGKIVETGLAEEIFYDPRHPYTWALLSSMPDLDTDGRLDAIPGTPPNMTNPPVGDAFAPRNKYALKIDFLAEPPEFSVSETHRAATWLLHPDAPRVELPATIARRIEKMRSKREKSNGKA